MKTAYDSSGRALNAPIFTLYGSQKGKRERKDLRKYVKR